MLVYDRCLSGWRRFAALPRPQACLGAKLGNDLLFLQYWDKPIISAILICTASFQGGGLAKMGGKLEDTQKQGNFSSPREGYEQGIPSQVT